MKKYPYKECILLGFPENCHHAEELAQALDIPYAEISLHYFPDGESKLSLPIDVLVSHKQAIIYRSLNFPNNKLVELILAAQGCRDNGLESLILVAPYLSYMRQDKAFSPGEVVSQKVIGKLLADYFDVVITVDAHLHRIKKLSEAIPCDKAINVNALDPITEFIQTNVDFPLLVGPDEESQQWVEKIASQGNFDFVVARKERKGDRDVRIELPDINYHNRNIVLLDDMASSGRTLIETAQRVAAYEPDSISAIVTHALFKQDVLDLLKESGVESVWSTDSIPHSTNVVSLADVLADALRSI